MQIKLSGGKIDNQQKINRIFGIGKFKKIKLKNDLHHF